MATGTNCCELATAALSDYYTTEYDLIYGPGGAYEKLQVFAEPEYSLRLALLLKATNHIDSAVRKALKKLACSDCGECTAAAIAAIVHIAILGIRSIIVLILDPKLSSDKCGDLRKLVNTEVVNAILGIRYILKYVFCPEDKCERSCSISESCSSTPSESCFSFSKSSTPSCTSTKSCPKKPKCHRKKEKKCREEKKCHEDKKHREERKPFPKPCLPCQGRKF